MTGLENVRKSLADITHSRPWSLVPLYQYPYPSTPLSSYIHIFLIISLYRSLVLLKQCRALAWILLAGWIVRTFSAANHGRNLFRWPATTCLLFLMDTVASLTSNRQPWTPSYLLFQTCLLSLPWPCSQEDNFIHWWLYVKHPCLNYVQTVLFFLFLF